jgi:hypothetical protein
VAYLREELAKKEEELNMAKCNLTLRETKFRNHLEKSSSPRVN